jgi:hypothetical protein
MKRRREPFAQSQLARSRKLYAQGKEMCAALELKRMEEGEQFGRYLMRPARWGTGYLWIEVVTLRGGVLVHGDCETCLFSGYGPSSHGPRGPIYWQARINPQYGAEKAGLGGTESSVWSADVAAYYVLDWRRHKSIGRELARELYDGLVSGWCEQEFCSAAYEGDVDGEDIANACDAVSRGVVVAQCALMRLVRLLEQRDFRTASRARFARSAA